MRSRTIVAAVIAAVFLIRPATSLSAAEGSDACSLLTQARVSALLGVSVGAGEHIVANAPSQCGWAQPSDTSHSGKRIVLDLFGSMGRLTPVDRFNNGKTPVKGIAKTPAAGIGDEAYQDPTQLFVRKGDHALELLDPDLAGIGSSGAAFRDAMVTLARTALPNL